MRRRSPAFILIFGLLATLVAGRPETRIRSADAIGAERWIVLFRQRSFDLGEYRLAIRADRPAAAVAAICDGLDRSAEQDQAPFAAAVQRLGGRVLHHWWLINGCAIEVPAGAGRLLTAEPNVLRIDRDDAPRPGDATTTGPRHPPASGGDRGDHGNASARALGLSGKGLGLAIIDTGQDEDCGGSRRPHRLYYPEGDGDVATGIAGSRLVQNLQLGTMSGDDRIGHGTAVAAIAAGAAWNAPGARAGHAPGAHIAGYAIAERQDGASSDATIVSAWQQVARDRAALHLVGANNSYCGSPNPTTAVQQALDSAAYNADLLVTVCAFNTGTSGTAHSQSACNGLAVGAVTQDDRAVCSYSARGPLQGDDQRTYPDLCATSSAIGPNPDCERSAGPWSGTSFAAPQVLGAAALVRQAAPAASALETKAILLASALDLDADNPELGRNATGVGMLRDDFAVATAAEPTRHRSVLVSGSTPVRIVFPVEAGQPCAVAITWHRTDFASRQWADVDLRIRDGDQVVATGASTRNLYEHVRFVPTRTGTCTAELVGVDLPQGTVEVAFAAASLPASPRAAGYRTKGRPCGSSALRAGAVLQHENGAATADDLQKDVLQLSATEWLFEFTAPTAGLTVTGFEVLLGLGDGPARVETALYTGAADGPRQLPEATASMLVGRQPGWFATRFAQPIAIAGGQTYYLALQSPGAARFAIVLQRGDAVHAFYRWPCSGAFVDGGRAAAALRVLGGAPTAGLEPQLGNVDLPRLGRTFSVQVTQAPANTPLLLATSVGADAAASLPIDMTRIGAPGCTAHVDPGALLAVVTDAAGTATLAFAIPADPRLCGLGFRQQAFLVDPAANALGLAATHVGEGRIGERE